MTDKDGHALITQTAAALLRGMSLASINEHVRSGRFRSQVKYGKRLVYKADVTAFEPKTHKKKHTTKPDGRPAKKAGKKEAATTASSTKKVVSKKKGGKK